MTTPNAAVTRKPVPLTGTAAERKPDSAGAASSPPRRGGFVRAVLGIPLPAKLAGATFLLVAGVIVVALTSHRAAGWDEGQFVLTLLVLGVTLAVQMGLVHLALHPLSELQDLAERVLAGDLNARSVPSLLADRSVRRLGRALNVLLDSLITERQRMRRLAILTIRSQDEERARLARELHESAAQHLTALMLELSAAAHEPDSAVLRAKMAQLRGTAGDILDDLRDLSQAVHPRALDDLGPVAAIEQLARHITQGTGPRVDVEAPASLGAMSGPIASTLYRVARAALENVVRHAGARQVWVRLSSDAERVSMSIVDDGRGFDVAVAEARDSRGLFSMREWVSLLGGSFAIASAARSGTRVQISIPRQLAGGSDT